MAVQMLPRSSPWSPLPLLCRQCPRLSDAPSVPRAFFIETQRHPARFAFLPLDNFRELSHSFAVQKLPRFSRFAGLASRPQKAGGGRSPPRTAANCLIELSNFSNLTDSLLYILPYPTTLPRSLPPPPLPSAAALLPAQIFQQIPVKKAVKNFPCAYGRKSFRSFG